MPMSKTKDIKLETTATYQPLSDLNVRFWSQDKNTAELRFIITRNQFPLSLSKENVKVIIALESGSSFISSDDFIIDSEVEGVARYIIPTDFMRVASNVTGQVYVTTLDKEEIIVERQFKFTVSNDLLSDYPSEDKLRYIKTFDDLRNEIASRVSKLESDMETMEDYVTQVQDITQEGITSLTNLIKQKQDAYNANHTAKLKELNDKGTEYSTKFDEDKQYIDEKSQAFKDAVNGSGVVTTAQSANWQKYKLTNDDGTRKYLNKGNFSDIAQLAPGFYETVTSDNAIGQGFPEGINNSSFVEIDITKAGAGRTQIKVVQNYNFKTFFKTIHTDGVDKGWNEIVYADPNNPFETVQESQAKANAAENNAKVYADSKVDEQHIVLFEGSVNGVGQTINMTESMFNYNLIIISGSTAAGDFDKPVLVNQNSGDNIIINILNLVDSSGNLGSAYELKLSKTNETTLTIANDVFFDYGTNKGSGKDANRFTIKRIEGWK